MSRKTLDDMNQLLRQALALARTEPQRALDLLESGLEKAKEISDLRAIATLAKHAGVVSSGLGELHRASAYFNEALAANLQDAHVCFATGDVLHRLGNSRDAGVAFARTLELATDQGDNDMIQMAKDALARRE